MECSMHTHFVHATIGSLVLTAVTAAAAQSPPAGLDFDFFKTRVQPIFTAKRPGHARCISCHIAGTPLRLQPLDLGVRLAQLVLEPQHELDAREVQPELGREALDDAQPLDVRLAVQAGAARRARRAHEALRLVQAERLRMHADELGRDADHLHAPIPHVADACLCLR